MKAVFCQLKCNFVLAILCVYESSVLSAQVQFCFSDFVCMKAVFCQLQCNFVLVILFVYESSVLSAQV